MGIRREPTLLLASVDTAVNLKQEFYDEVEEHEGHHYPGRPPGNVRLR